MDRRRGIGKDNKLPWRLSSDLKKFRELTMGHHLIAGRNTFESIGRPLPGRDMIVVTRNQGYKPEGCLIAHSVEAAIELARARGESEAFVIGGGQIYGQALAVADRIYLTEVEAVTDADTFFPAMNLSEWEEKVSAYQEADDKNQYGFTFKLLVRKR
jgi:dihydrofolate reductase